MKSSPTLRALAGALVLAAVAGSAFARNDRLLLPIAAALENQATDKATLTPAIPLRFGRAAATTAESEPWVEVRGAAQPFSSVSSQSGNARDYKPDPVVCREAFRKALAELQYRAQAAGATAVVDIQSFYKRVEFDSPETYECHAGNTRAVVDLRARLNRGAAPAR